MSRHTEIVQQYLEGMRRSDHAMVLACLTDDVVWVIHGTRTTRGKAEFGAEIENPMFQGSPDLVVERIIEALDAVVVTGVGVGFHREAGPYHFAFSDLFTFRAGLVGQVDSYLVPTR